MKSNLIAKLVLASSLAVSLAYGEGLFVGPTATYNFKQDTKGILEIPLNAMSIVNNNGGLKTTENKYGIGLKFGYDFDLWRVYTAFIYDSGGEESRDNIAGSMAVNTDSSDFLLGIDWTPNFSEQFKMLTGIMLGASKHTTDISLSISSLTYETQINQTGFVYGLRLGGIYGFNKHNEIEFGFEIKEAKYSDKYTTNFNIVNLKRTTAGMFIGYSYKF